MHAGAFICAFMKEEVFKLVWKNESGSATQKSEITSVIETIWAQREARSEERWENVKDFSRWSRPNAESVVALGRRINMRCVAFWVPIIQSVWSGRNLRVGSEWAEAPRSPGWVAAVLSIIRGLQSPTQCAGASSGHLSHRAENF